MRIGRGSISFMVMRSKEIRSRRLKMIRSSRSQNRSSAKRNQSVRAKYARTLAEKNAAINSSQRKTSTAASVLQNTKANYTDMERAAGNVVQYLETLLRTGEKGLWGNNSAESKMEPDRAKIEENVIKWVEQYNDMVESLTSEGGTLNELYKRQFHNFAVSHRSKLEQVGITEDAYGKLSLDKKILQSAEIEKLQNVFQGEGSFADKVCNRSKAVKENAETNLHSLNNATYSSLLENYGVSGSRFNYRA